MMFLRSHPQLHDLPLLLENDIQWILVWSKLDSNYKTELTFNPIHTMVYIIAGNITSLEEYDKELNNLGVTNYEVSYGNSIFKIIPNAKIITDVLYFIFENIYKLKVFSNHKIVTSSG